MRLLKTRKQGQKIVKTDKECKGYLGANVFVVAGKQKGGIIRRVWGKIKREKYLVGK